MQGTLSRRKIAAYVASHVESGMVPAAVIQEVAAYLVGTGTQRQAELVVRAIEDALSEHGVTVATVTTARPLDDETRTSITKHIGTREVYLRETTDPGVIGGMRLQTPDASLDTTIAHKLTLLRGAKQ